MLRARGRAPEVRFVDYEGREFSLGDYRGRPVALNFWPSWCPLWAAEMPDFEKVHRSGGDEVVFVGIAQCESCQGGNAGAARKRAVETGVMYRLAEDPNGSVFVAFGGSSMRTTIFIDAESRVVDDVEGMLEASQRRDYIAPLFGVGSA